MWPETDNEWMVACKNGIYSFSPCILILSKQHCRFSHLYVESLFLPVEARLTTWLCVAKWVARVHEARGNEQPFLHIRACPSLLHSRACGCHFHGLKLVWGHLKNWGDKLIVSESQACHWRMRDANHDHRSLPQSRVTIWRTPAKDW